MTVSRLETLLSNGVGAIVLLLPNKKNTNTLNEHREPLLHLEEHLLASEIEIPIYFAEDTEHTSQLLDDLNISTGVKGQKTSAAQGNF